MVGFFSRKIIYMSSRHSDVGELNVTVICSGILIESFLRPDYPRIDVPIPSRPIFLPMSPMLIPGFSRNVLERYCEHPEKRLLVIEHLLDIA